MTTQVAKPTLRQIMDFFFEAHLTKGWVSDTPEIHKLSPGHDAVFHSADDFYFIDQWFTSPCVYSEDFSHGQTIIKYEQSDIFVMNYFGWYTKEAITNVVIPVLRSSYTAGEFCGGRGAETYVFGVHYTNEDLGIPYHVTNDLTDPMQIVRFAGIEKVVGHRGIPLGFHQYQGMVLAKDLPIE